MGQWTYEEDWLHEAGCEKYLCHLGIYQEKKRIPAALSAGSDGSVLSGGVLHGLWYPYKNPGDVIRKGEILGEVRDYWGNLMEVSQAEMDGVILSCTGSLQVLQEGP